MTAPATLQVARSRRDLAEARDRLRGSVAVVMTMGALHEGHAELVREARRLADSVVVTVFVNPLQFGPAEDLDRYPRTLEADVELVAAHGADLVFAPTPDVVYPQSPLVRVGAGPLGQVLEGASRPGHFDGVLTVVLKLLHLVRPDVALFGEKDAQQLACIRAMVRDLDVPVQVVGVPTVREPDGLALSSRNRYLAPDERRAALALFRALRTVAETGSVPAGRAVLEAEPLVATDYLERVDPRTFARADDGELAVVAARVGTTRLIDNLHLGRA
jgi:pantoate--beta-alanine ligase